MTARSRCSRAYSAAGRARTSARSLAGVVALCLAAIIAAAPVGAAEPTAAAALAKGLKEIHQRLLKANDVWSALQLQSYAKAHGIELHAPPGWSGVEILGDPVFACPDDIITGVDVGPAVVVVTRGGVHRFAPAGYPLTPARRFGFSADFAAVSSDGAYAVAFCPYVRSDPKPQIWMGRVLNLGTGAAVDFSGIMPEKAMHQGEVAMAEDGTAIAIGCREINGKTYVIIGTAAGGRVVPGVTRALGVGPKGAWLIASGEAATSQVLVHGDARADLAAYAIGPGVAAVVTTGGEPFVVSRTGSLAEVGWPKRVGATTTLESVGGWLSVVVGGTPEGPKVEGWMPGSMSVFRWDDLAIGVPGSASRTFHGRGLRLINRTASVCRWHGNEVIRIALEGDEPVESVIATCEEPVLLVTPRTRGATVLLESGRTVALDDDGKLLGSASGDFIIYNRQYGLQLRADGTRILRLSRDPLARSSATIKLPQAAGNWIWWVDPFHDGLYASDAHDWLRIGDDGAIVARGDLRSDPVPWSSWPAGRFFWRFGRIHAKDGPIDPPLSQRFTARDAWTSGRGMIVLGRDKHLLSTGRKRGEFIELERTIEGNCIARAPGKEDLVICDSTSNSPQATILVAPAVALADGVGETVDPLPAGPYRIDQLRYAVPSGPGLQWDQAKTGFLPERLRSWKDGPGLVAVTASLVFCMDAEAAKAAGKK
jgi:hypothetical protein